MPWMWPDTIFKLLPDGRAHARYLDIVHRFTKKVIDDRARDFHASEMKGKRSAFLGINENFPSPLLVALFRSTSQTNARRTVDTFGYSRRS